MIQSKNGYQVNTDVCEVNMDVYEVNTDVYEVNTNVYEMKEEILSTPEFKTKSLSWIKKVGGLDFI